jgi:glycosyltransferase involved in cell wall biosynthesis
MRVALLTLATPLPDRPSIGRYNIAQCKAINALGHTAEIFTCAPKVPQWTARLSKTCDRHASRSGTHVIDGIKVTTTQINFVYSKLIRERFAPYFPQTVSKSFSSQSISLLRPKLKRFNPDLIVVHGIMPWAETAVQLSGSLHARLVAIEHSQSDIDRIETCKRIRHHYKKMGARFDQVFTVNQRMMKTLSMAGVKRARQIYNGIERVEKAHTVRSNSDTFDILCVGAYIERKGHRVLLEAVSRIKKNNIRLKLVGLPTVPLLKHIKKLGLSDVVEVLPEMNQRDLREQMRCADLFALPSWDEAFGLVYAESLSVNTPVLLTTDAGVLNLPFVREASWVVAPRNVSDIEIALRSLLENHHTDKQVSLDQASRWINQHLTWEQNAKVLLGLSN